MWKDFPELHALAENVAKQPNIAEVRFISGRLCSTLSLLAVHQEPQMSDPMLVRAAVMHGCVL